MTLSILYPKHHFSPVEYLSNKQARFKESGASSAFATAGSIFIDKWANID